MTANGTKTRKPRSKTAVEKTLDHPVGRGVPELSASRLRIVMYVPGTRQNPTKTTEISGRKAEMFGLVVDAKSGFWSYTREVPPNRHQYRIGHCVRPVGEGCTGPMMVYDLDEPQQVRWMNENVEAYRNGTLDKLAAPGPKNLRTVSTVELVERQ